MTDQPTPVATKRRKANLSRQDAILKWDNNIGTVHNAVADYVPPEPRRMQRAQALATLDYRPLVA
jgi:hypothetical protein